jgi:transcriptional regulator with XRE-family HTH domain
MKRYSYSERDYAFGQLMLTLRTTIGLTQAGLGERLGVSRRAVAEWEGGLSYPKAERLKLLIELGCSCRSFPPGAMPSFILLLLGFHSRTQIAGEVMLSYRFKQREQRRCW